MERVERAVDDQGSAFSWFQAAATLEETVRQRTQEYEQLNQRLKRELGSRREIELALKQAKAQAELANQSKTRFLAAASHDLRQPLSSALLFLESVETASLGGRDRDYVHKAQVALASVSNLLGTLLDVARLDSGSIEPHYAHFPAAAVLDRIVPEFEGVARAAGLELGYVPSRAWVRSDMYLLETVLRNLISNAIRYTPRGRVLVGCRRRRDGLEIRVHDTGIGIAGRAPRGDLRRPLPGARRRARARRGHRPRAVDRGPDREAAVAGALRALDAGARLDVRGARAVRPGAGADAAAATR